MSRLFVLKLSMCTFDREFDDTNDCFVPLGNLKLSFLLVLSGWDSSFHIVFKISIRLTRFNSSLTLKLTAVLNVDVKDLVALNSSQGWKLYNHGTNNSGIKSGVFIS